VLSAPMRRGGIPGPERGRKRVRVLLGGLAVADTGAPLLVWEHRWYPAYHFPRPDVSMHLLTPTGGAIDDAHGRAELFDVRAGAAVAPAAARLYQETADRRVHGTVRFVWDAMDRWLEEDEQVFVHPRNPYTRIDVLASSRRIEVSVGGLTLADSKRPLLLFETGLPVRAYLPAEDVRTELLEPSPAVTRCPYKGTAVHWSAAAGGERFPDIAWTYQEPLPECGRIRDLVAFYDERVAVRVDGIAQAQPRTKFS
jgi:uncharacterized protein (DUF427 family)